MLRNETISFHTETKAAVQGLNFATAIG